MERPKEQETLTTLKRGFDIIELLMRRNGARVTEIAEILNIATSTAYKYLATLYDLGYVVKEGDTYYVGMRFLTVGSYTKHRKKTYEISIQMVRRLAKETGERVQFLVEEHGRGIYLHTAVDDMRQYGKVITNRQFGRRRHLHSSAAGKAILASFPPERVTEIVDRWGLPKATENTITDPADLESELAQIRSAGVAFNNEESVEGLRAVGVPVSGPQGRTVGGLSISGPVHRLKGEQCDTELSDLLLASANEIELTIVHS